MLRPAFATSACIIICAGLFLAGLWPFNFQLGNRAGLLPGGIGLRFDAPAVPSKQNKGGMVFTPNPLLCRSKETCEAGSLTIKLGLTADSEAGGCIKRILEVRRPDGSEAFYLGQWRSSLIVRSFNTPPAGGKPYREMGVGEVLAAGRRSMVTIASGLHGTDFYVDGRPVRNYPGARLLRGGETLEGHKLYLGNSPDLGCPWAGSVFNLSLFGKIRPPGEAVDGQYPTGGDLIECGQNRIEAMASYRFETLAGDSIADLSGFGNDLWKPEDMVFDKRLLGLPDGQSLVFFDLAVNLAGFMPFGFMICLRLLMVGRLSARDCILFALAAGFAVSLVIEVTQVWLPGRDSSMLDLGANTLGTLIGGGACVKVKNLWGVCAPRVASKITQ